jgi:hypothetical protein
MIRFQEAQEVSSLSARWVAIVLQGHSNLSSANLEPTTTKLERVSVRYALSELTVNKPA